MLDAIIAVLLETPGAAEDTIVLHHLVAKKLGYYPPYDDFCAEYRRVTLPHGTT